MTRAFIQLQKNGLIIDVDFKKTKISFFYNQAGIFLKIIRSLRHSFY